MIVYAEVECMLYDGHSLKQKRSVLKRLIHKLRNELNVAVAELDYHNLWQRTKLGMVTISNQSTHAEQIIQSALKIVDQFPELERTITHVDER